MYDPRVKLSVLDLSPVPQGGTAAIALRNSLDLARHVEALGFTRYWVAEHHNHPGIASAATAVVIGHIAAGTSRTSPISTSVRWRRPRPPASAS